MGPAGGLVDSAGAIEVVEAGKVVGMRQGAGKRGQMLVGVLALAIRDKADGHCLRMVPRPVARPGLRDPMPDANV